MTGCACCASRTGWRCPSATRRCRRPAAAFVRYVDADDVVEAGSTARLLDVARRHPGGALAYGATLLCDEALVPLAPGQVASSDLEGDVSARLRAGRLRRVRRLHPLPAGGGWSAAGRGRSARSRSSGDWDYVLARGRARARAPPRQIVTRYRRHPRSLTKAGRRRRGRRRPARLVLDRYFARHPELRGTPLERRAYVRVHADRALAHAWAGGRGRRRPGARRRRPPRSAGGARARGPLGAAGGAADVRDAAARRARRRGVRR